MKGWAVGTNAEREDSDDLFSDVKKEQEGKTRMSNSPMSRKSRKSIDVCRSTRMTMSRMSNGRRISLRSVLFLRRSWRFAGPLYFSQDHNQHQHQHQHHIHEQLMTSNQCAVTFMIHVALILLLIPLSRFCSVVVWTEIELCGHSIKRTTTYALSVRGTEHTKAESTGRWEWWALIRMYLGARVEVGDHQAW